MKLKLILISALLTSQMIVFGQWSGTNPVNQSGNATITGHLQLGSAFIPASPSKLNLYGVAVGAAASGAPFSSYTTGIKLTHRWSGTGTSFTSHIWDIGADHKNLYFQYSNNSDKILTLNTYGQVGIGTTTTPNAKLHIKSSGQSLKLEAVSNTSSPASEATDIVFSNPATPGTKRDWVIRSTGPNHPTSAEVLEFWAPEFQNPKVYFPDNIKVGIGTTTASNAKLHIRSSGESLKLEAVPNAGSPASEATDIVFSNPATPGTKRDWVIRSTGPNHPTSPELLEFWAPEFQNPKVYYPGNIKVGIGTANMPGNYQLYVAEGILTEKVKVALKTTADWADYVFADDYELKSLTEVDQFIKDHHHLPEMPSAEDVVASGIDVAKMDAKLLEKIEELMLYTIQQEEKIEQLQQQVHSLTKKSNQ